MFAFTAKLTKKRAITGILIIGFVLIVTVVTVSVFKAGVLVPSFGAAGSKGERLDFIRSYGWQVDEDSEQSKSVIIPKVFDDVYTRYNAIQLEQNLDLRTLAGRQVAHYSYLVTNYPTGEQNVRINLLVYKNRVVGGDVMSPRLDGFMHGFMMP